MSDADGTPNFAYRAGWMAAMSTVRDLITKQGDDPDPSCEDPYEHGWNMAGHRLQVSVMRHHWFTLSGGKVKPVYRIRARSRRV